MNQNIFTKLKQVFFILLISFCMVTTIDARAGGAGKSKSSSRPTSSSTKSTNTKSTSTVKKSTPTYSNTSSSKSKNSYTTAPVTKSKTTKGAPSGSFGSFIFAAVIFLIIFALIIFIIIKSSKGIIAQATDTLESYNGELLEVSLPQALATLPLDASEIDLIGKCETAFTKIQVAWGSMDIKPIRKFISDGMYQKFKSQFMMMKELGQHNEVDAVEIINCKIADASTDGVYDTVTFQLYATMHDTFVSPKYPELNDACEDAFIEYWTFIRKHDIQSKGDLYDTDNCPNCGGDVSAIVGDMAKCAYCGAATNSGEYDWVLCEISQSGYFEVGESTDRYREAYIADAENIRKYEPNYSVQLLEDKVSNAFYQIMTAQALDKPELVARFTDTLYNFTAHNVLYNRLYINAVNQNGYVDITDEYMEIEFEVKYGFQRVRKNSDGSLEIMDNEIQEQTNIYTMKHALVTSETKGNLYAGECPSCGAPVDDTGERNCSYCGELYNSGKNEWIISKIS